MYKRSDILKVNVGKIYGCVSHPRPLSLIRETEPARCPDVWLPLATEIQHVQRKIQKNPQFVNCILIRMLGVHCQFQFPRWSWVTLSHWLHNIGILLPTRWSEYGSEYFGIYFIWIHPTQMDGWTVTMATATRKTSPALLWGSGARSQASRQHAGESK